MEKWRGKDWRARGECEHLEKAEEKLTGRKIEKGGKRSAGEREESRVESQGGGEEARGHHGL